MFRDFMIISNIINTILLSLGIAATAQFGVSQDLYHQIQVLSAKYEVSATTTQAIIWCESRGKSDVINENVSKITGKVWSTDIGYWQFNDHFWQKQAIKDGFDINDPDQNLEYGFFILSKQGTTAWKASRQCSGV